MKNLLLLAITVIITLCSCSRTVNCSTPPFTIQTVGFTSADLGKTGKIFKYKADGLFDSFIDSGIVYFNAGANDTFTTSAPFPPGYDYKLLMTGNGSVFTITGITPGSHLTQSYSYTPGDGTNSKDIMCFNNIQSYTVNGTKFAGSAAQNPGQYLYIVK